MGKLDAGICILDKVKRRGRREKSEEGLSEGAMGPETLDSRLRDGLDVLENRNFFGLYFRELRWGGVGDGCYCGWLWALLE